MKDRDLLIDDLQDVESILLALDGVAPEMQEKAVIKALARAVYHVLIHAVHVIDRKEKASND